MGKRGEIWNILKKGLFYLCLHTRLDGKVLGNRLMNKKEFFKILGEIYHIPSKKIRVLILKEMEEKGMIKDLHKEGNKRYIKIMPLFCNPEERYNKFAEELGVF